jgi:acetylornithine deacetylase/succinyl-diaminopimelate desuccinylase-like protein
MEPSSTTVLARERSQLEPVFEYIDQHAGAFVERLRALCRQPSVSAQALGVEETFTMVDDMAREVGAQTRRIDLDGGPPILHGRVGIGARTLQLYDHYDVQPPEPLELWHHAPFVADIADGRIWARGVSDNKGNLVARLCAIEAYRRTLGELPLTVTLLFEGEEEVGSPHLRQFTNGPLGQELLKVDGCIWEAGYKDPIGRPTVALGCKGILYVELRARSAAKDLHSSWAAAIPNAAWRLTWALSTLKDERTGRVLIPGFYERVKVPSERTVALADREPFDVAQYRALFGIKDFLSGWDGHEARRHYLFDPTCTICGLTSGYQGPGGKTVLPAEASAKLDFRLVPDQDPDEILQLLRTHLAASGFGDVEVEEVEGEGERAARTDPDAPIATAVVETARELYGLEPLVLPNMAGTGPQYLLCAQFGVPAVGTGVGNADSNNHAPNENIVVDDYIQGIKHMAWVFHHFATA